MLKKKSISISAKAGESPLFAEAQVHQIGEVFYRTIDGVLAIFWMAIYFGTSATILITGWKPLGVVVPTSDAIAGLCLPVAIALIHIRHRVYFPASQVFNIWSAISTTALAVIPLFIRFGV